MMSVTLLVTYTFRREVVEFSHERTMVESVQANTSDRGRSKSLAEVRRRRAVSLAPQSSSLGMVNPLSGATLVFEVNKLTVTEVSEYLARM